MTDIFIFLDTTWNYKRVVDYVNYVVERLNINPYASSVTLLAARDGSVMVNRTFYITEFYENWNITTHTWYRAGFNLPIILSKARHLAQSILNEELNTGSLGGRSLIALLVPSPSAFVYDYDFDYCQNFVSSLNQTIPQLEFIYYAGGAVVRFTDYVSNSADDIFPLNTDRKVTTCGEPVVRSIRRVPRRLTSPRCSARWSLQGQGYNELWQYESLGKINFYRMSPHNFFHEGSMRFLKVKAISSVVFAVCTSRVLGLPYRNPSSPFTAGQDCKQISSSEFAYDLTEMCTGYDQLLDCPPLYMSVQSQGFADTSQVSCTSDACYSPTDAEYVIYVNNLECTSGSQEQPKKLALVVVVVVVGILL